MQNSKLSLIIIYINKKPADYYFGDLFIFNLSIFSDDERCYIYPQSVRLSRLITFYLNNLTKKCPNKPCSASHNLSTWVFSDLQMLIGWHTSLRFYSREPALDARFAREACEFLHINSKGSRTQIAL